MRAWLVAAFLIALLTNGSAFGRTEAAAPTGGRSQQASRSGDQITTLSGDHLTGEIVGLDCHGLRFRYLGNVLLVPVAHLAAASSAARVPVHPGRGDDRLTGRIHLKGATVYVRTRDLGTLALPVAAFRCAPAAQRNAVAVAAPGRTQAQGRVAPPQEAALSLRPEATAPLSAAVMAGLRGTGSNDEQYDRKPSEAAPAAAENRRAATPTAVTGTAPANQPAPSGQPPKSSKAPRSPKEQQEESERNTLEFLRREAVLVRPMKVEGDFSLSYLHTNQVLGNERVVSLATTLRVGIVRDLEGFIALPLVWGQRQTNVFSGTISNELMGVGDVRLGLKYRAIRERPGVPDVVLGLSTTAPSGKPPYFAPVAAAGIVTADTRDPLNIHIGTGHWAVTGSVTALKAYDPLVVYASLNYTHFFPDTFYGVRVVPGDVWEANTGFGFAVNEGNTLSAQLFIDDVQKWQFNGVAVPQTGITPISLKFGYIHVLSPSDLIEPSVIWGLTRDANDAVVALDYIHRF